MSVVVGENVVVWCLMVWFEGMRHGLGGGLLLGADGGGVSGVSCHAEQCEAR